MKFKAIQAGVLAALCFFAISGCSSSNPGNPEPTTSSAAGSEGNSGAPAIPSPALGGDKYLKTPCSLATPAQLAPLKVEAGKSRVNDAGTFCNWDSVDVHNPSYSSGVTDQTTLKGLYQKREDWPIFNEVKIGGYPAVEGSPDQKTLNGSCFMYVGISENMTLNVSVNLADPKNPNYQNPCPLADRFAESIVGNLKGGQ